MKFSMPLMAAAVALTIANPASATPIDPIRIISTFGTVALNDLEFGGSHTDASIYVGGDLSGSSSGSTGWTPGEVSDDLQGQVVVGGDITGSFTINESTAQVGGTGTVNGGNNSVTNGVAIPTADVTAAIEGLSDFLASLTDTTGAAFTNPDQNMRTLTSGAGSNGLAVLTMDDLTFLGQGTLAQERVNIDPDVTFVVNVPGTQVNISVNSNVDNANVIFNFFEATNLTINSTFGFGVLAPYADIRLLSGGTDTFVAGNNIFSNSEVRGSFTGSIIIPETAAVPLPAGLVLLLGGIGALGIARRRTTA